MQDREVKWLFTGGREPALLSCVSFMTSPAADLLAFPLVFRPLPSFSSSGAEVAVLWTGGERERRSRMQ